MTAKQPKGLTRIIYETMLDLTPDILARGGAWSKNDLDEVAVAVYRQINTNASRRDRLVFDLIYRRCFAEAAGLLEKNLGLVMGLAHARPGHRLAANA